MAKKKKQEQLELAALKGSSQELPATSSESSRSSRNSAKRAPTTRSKRNKELALYIIKKYVVPTNIVWARDMTIAYRLIKTFSDIEFWKTLPVKKQCDSLLILACEKSKIKLKYQWEEYKKRLIIQKSIKIEESKPIVLGEKVGEDYVLPVRKPKSILEFCK